MSKEQEARSAEEVYFDTMNELEDRFGPKRKLLNRVKKGNDVVDVCTSCEPLEGLSSVENE